MEMLQPPALVGFLSAETSLAATSTIYFSAIRDVCGARGKVGEENENLVYPSPWGLQRVFNMQYNFTTWDLRLYFPSDGRCAADFYRP
jgi:hypothetical protein